MISNRESSLNMEPARYLKARSNYVIWFLVSGLFFKILLDMETGF